MFSQTPESLSALVPLKQKETCRGLCRCCLQLPELLKVSSFWNTLNLKTLKPQEVFPEKLTFFSASFPVPT